MEKCTACALTINASCNNFRISKTYNSRASLSGSQSEVLNSYKRAEYENRDAVLNVYCGVSEGIVAGVDVLSSNRAEFFLVGRPLKGILLA